MKRSSPSAARNIEPIGRVLREWLPKSGLVLEIASGTGEHGLAFASAFPDLIWQPTDLDAAARASIAAWQADNPRLNYRAPLSLDASADDWPVAQADAILAINMVHISPWEATIGLLAGSKRCLCDQGALILYGPYWQDDAPKAPSNLAFDQSLQSRNSGWGIRNISDMMKAAAEHSLSLVDQRTMPANNMMLCFRKIS